MSNPYNNDMEDGKEPNIREEYRELLTNYLQNLQYLSTCMNHYLHMTMEDQQMFMTDIINFNSELEGLLRDINADDINGEGFKPPNKKSAIPNNRNYSKDDDIGDEYYQ